MHEAELQKEGVGSRHETDTPNTEPNTAATVPGIKALALALGVNRCTIYEWLKLPGHPGGSQSTGYDVEAWRTFEAGTGASTPVLVGPGGAGARPATQL